MKKYRLKTVSEYLLFFLIFISLLTILVACGGIKGGNKNNVNTPDNNTNNSDNEQIDTDTSSLSVSTDSYYIAKTSSPLSQSELMDFLKLSATYTSGKTEMHIDRYSLSIDNMSEIDTSVEGTYEVSVSYSDAKCVIIVIVGAQNTAAVSSISINDDMSAMKLNFAYGEDFDPSGIVLNVLYDNGETGTIDNSEISAICPDYNKYHNTKERQEYRVTVSYKGNYVFYNVYVAPKPDDRFVGIRIIESLSKIEYEYGENLSANDFELEYEYSSIDEYGKTFTYFSQTTPSSTYTKTVSDTGEFNAFHGVESDQTYEITVSYGNFTCACDVTVKKAPAHIVSARIVSIQNFEENSILPIAKGTAKISETDFFNLLTVEITYSYGDPVEIQYNGNEKDFIVDDSEYYRFGDVGNIYHIDLYYKGVRVKSILSYSHECNLPDSEYGFDIRISDPESHALENTEYMFIPSDSAHKINFYRGEVVSESILKENLIVNVVNADGLVCALQSDEYTLTYDDSQFPDAIPIRVSNGKITKTFEAYPLDVTVALSETGLSSYGNAYSEIKYRIYRMPDRTIKSITANRYTDTTAEIDYKNAKNLSSYVGLSFTVNYSDGTSTVIRIKEDGTFDNADFSNATVNLDFDGNSLPDEMFESGGYLSDITINFDYCVYAFTGDEYSTEKDMINLAASAFFPSAALVTKTPEIKGIYVNKSEACKIFYRDNDTVELSDYAVYCYYDYSKEPDKKLSETEYKAYIDTTYYNNGFVTDITTGADAVSITFKYLPDGVYDQTLDFSINNSINSSGARIQVIVVPNGYNLYMINDAEYAFTDVSFDKTEYIVFIDNELSVNDLSFTANFVNYAKKVKQSINIGDLPNGFALYSDINALSTDFDFNKKYKNCPVYLAYTDNESNLSYGKTAIDFVYAKDSVSAEYTLDLSELTIKTVYNIGEEFLMPEGNMFIMKNGVRIENLSKNLAELLSVNPSDSIGGVSLEGARVDYSEFNSATAGKYTVKVQWTHYLSGSESIMLEASYSVAVTDQNTAYPFDGYAPFNYDFIDFDSSLNANVYVYNRKNTFKAELDFGEDTYKKDSALYSLAQGICTPDNFNTNVLKNNEITEYGYYTLRVYEKNNPLVSYYYIRYAKPENIFGTFTVNGNSVSVYDNQNGVYTDCVFELNNPEATISYTLKQNRNATVVNNSDESVVSDGDLLTLSGNSLVLSVTTLNSSDETVCRFYVTLVYNSPIKQIALNGIVATRINGDTESFALTLPENTRSYLPVVSLAEGYSASLSLMGLPLDKAPVFIGENKVNVNVSYYGNYICTYSLMINVQYPLCLTEPGITLYGENFPFKSQYSIPERMNFTLTSTNPDIRISVESISGKVIAVLNDNEIDIPLLYGRNDLVVVFNVDNEIYKKYVRVYKVNDNDQSYSEYDISELTKNIEVRAFGTMGILTDKDTFYIPISADNINNAAYDSVMVIGDYSVKTEQTFNLNSILSYSYCPKTHRYAYLISFNAKNVSTVYTKRFYVYLIPTDQNETVVPEKIRLGNNLIGTDEFTAVPNSENVFSKSVSLTGGVYEYSIINNDIGTTISDPILLTSTNGIPNNYGNDTRNCIYTDDSNGYETYMLNLSQGEYSIIFTVINGISQRHLKYILTMIIE